MTTTLFDQSFSTFASSLQDSASAPRRSGWDTQEGTGTRSPVSSTKNLLTKPTPSWYFRPEQLR